jgi:hypothetical protein
MTPDQERAWRWLGVGVDFSAEPRDPTPDEMHQAITRLSSCLAEYHQSGRLREARRYWMDRARELEPSRRAKATLVLNVAMERLGAGDAP